MTRVISHATGRTAAVSGKRVIYIRKIKFATAKQSAPPSAKNTTIRTKIKQARKFLESRLPDNGRWLAKTPQFEVGMTALSTLALLKSGSKPDDPVITKALAYLREAESSLTYEVALQALALSEAKQPQDMLIIRRCVDWLEEAQVTAGAHQGGWSYRQMKDATRADNSNTEMAIWALHAARQAGVAVGKETWKRAYDYWKRSQRGDGSWGYIINHGAGTGSMTCSGIASLAICAEQLKRAKEPMDAATSIALKNGLKWIDRRMARVRPRIRSRAQYEFRAAVSFVIKVKR